jgi:AcrR family transcriptional regulator
VLLLGDKQLDDVTVEDVAGRAHVSPSLVFHYFGTQRGLRRALAEEAAQELLAQIAPDPAHRPVDQLHDAIDRFTAYVKRQPGLFLATTRVSGANLDLRELHAGVWGMLSAWLLTALHEAGAPATPALEATVTGWLAFSEEVVVNWLTEPKLTRGELVALCESALYPLVRIAINDDDLWQRVEMALRTVPGSTVPGSAVSDSAVPGAAVPGDVL